MARRLVWGFFHRSRSAGPVSFVVLTCSFGFFSRPDLQSLSLSGCLFFIIVYTFL
jgi:hypothetical protein